MARKVVGFDEDDLRTLAGARSFERGLGYLDAVSGLEVGEGSVTAVVHGTDVYEMELTLGGEEGVSGWCDCPYGQEADFCKHCVAVGLTVLRRAKTIPHQRAAARARSSGLEAWLSAQSRDELVCAPALSMARRGSVGGRGKPGVARWWHKSPRERRDRAAHAGL